MNGFKINYIEKDGSRSSTFYGEPVTNMNLSAAEIIQLMFFQAHPGCVMLSCTRCTLEAYKSETSK